MIKLTVDGMLCCGEAWWGGRRRDIDVAAADWRSGSSRADPQCDAVLSALWYYEDSPEHYIIPVSSVFSCEDVGPFSFVHGWKCISSFWLLSSVDDIDVPLVWLCEKHIGRLNDILINNCKRFDWFFPECFGVEQGWDLGGSASLWRMNIRVNEECCQIVNARYRCLLYHLFTSFGGFMRKFNSAFNIQKIIGCTSGFTFSFLSVPFGEDKGMCRSQSTVTFFKHRENNFSRLERMKIAFFW